MRVKVRLVVAAAAGAMLVVSSCGAGTSGLGGVSSPGAVSTPASHGGMVRDHVSFVDALRGAGVRVEIMGSTSRPALRPHGTKLSLTGGPLGSAAVLESYNYDSTDLGQDGALVARSDVDRLMTATPAGEEHVFLKDRVVVLYPGSAAPVLTLLEGLLGPQVTGRVQPSSG